MQIACVSCGNRAPMRVLRRSSIGRDPSVLILRGCTVASRCEPGGAEVAVPGRTYLVFPRKPHLASFIALRFVSPPPILIVPVAFLDCTSCCVHVHNELPVLPFETIINRPSSHPITFLPLHILSLFFPITLSPYRTPRRPPKPPPPLPQMFAARYHQPSTHHSERDGVLTAVWASVIGDGR